MDIPRGNDRMSSMPLLDMTTRESDSPSGNDHLSWSDQEFEDGSHDPLEGVLRSVLLRPRAISRQQCVLSATFVAALSIALGFFVSYFGFFVLYPPLCHGPTAVTSNDMNITKWILDEVNPYFMKEYLSLCPFGPQSYAGKHPEHQRAMVSKRVFLSGLLAAAILCGILGTLLGHLITRRKSVIPAEDEAVTFPESMAADYLRLETDPSEIRDVLRNLTLKPHIAGSPQNRIVAEYIRDKWISNGLSNVKLVPYDVVLSYPNETNPNMITVTDPSGQTVVSIVAQKNPDTLVTPTFSAYSGSGHVTGEPVYVNFGTPADFRTIHNRNIDLKGKIVIARYGVAYRGNIVKMAERYNASGVVLFSDPHEYAPQGRAYVYPESFYLPGNGTQPGTLLISPGDPSTPGYPSVEGAYRIPDSEFPLPKIPVQPISYEDAEKILRLMGGDAAPEDWRGSLNVSYAIGPGFSNTALRLHLYVNNGLRREKIYNVIGTIPGSLEPDRYVLLGNHYDAWTYGGVDPNSATAVLIELTRVFGTLLKKGWKPRRTMIFCSWDAEEYGLIGSSEWLEENGKILSERAVAYLNVDLAVEGNYTLHMAASPSLYDVVQETAKKIPNPNPSEVSQGRPTVFDTWQFTSNSNKTNKPNISALGDGSDHAAFIFIAGVPSCDFYYTGDKKWYPVGLPLYHSIFETYDAVDRILDPGFQYHTAVAKLWGELARTLADSPLLPFSMTSYAEQVETALKDFQKHFGPVLKSLERLSINLELLEAAVHEFAQAAKTFHSNLARQKITDPIVLRMVNDQMMQVERAFIQPETVPLTSNYRHVLLAPSSTDSYSGSYFPGLVNLISNIDLNNSTSIQIFQQHLAAVTFYIKSAALVLEGLL